MQDLHELPAIWFERVWNQKDESAIDEMLESEYKAYGLGPVMTCAEDFKIFHRAYLQAFPDLHFVVDHVIAEGEWTSTRITAAGTHQGDLNGIAPTNNRISVTGIIMARWRNGRLIEAHNSVDMLGLLQQLGVPIG